MTLPAFLDRLLCHFSSNKANTTEKKQQTVPVSSNSSSTTNTSTIKATPAAAKMPGVTAPSGTSKYDQIPGPLGSQSSKLDGKVALVTGAGTCSFSLLSLWLLSLSRMGCHVVPSYAGCKGINMIDKGWKGAPAPDGMSALPQPNVRFPHVPLRRRPLSFFPQSIHLSPFPKTIQNTTQWHSTPWTPTTLSLQGADARRSCVTCYWSSQGLRIHVPQRTPLVHHHLLCRAGKD